jgi:PAT family beta-lactamase induction signal transducer AmpG
MLLLGLVGLYRVSDIVLGVIANLFYQDMGYTKIQIAEVGKVFGMLMSIAGGFSGGVLAVRFGVMRILLLGAILSAVTNLLFIVLVNAGSPDMPLLFAVIGADNLAAGLASAAFIAFLSSLTNISFTAVQYAIFSSLMTLFPKVLGGYSGSMVEHIGYPQFFIMTTLLTIPVIPLILLAGKHFDGQVTMAK